MVPEKKSAWETESGLIDDVDAWIANAKFGTKDEYAEAVLASGGTTVGIMFLVDLADENGEIIGSQGWSIGTGWEVSDDGLEITHPKRKNVVHSSMYGQLQNIVTRELEVDMDDCGLPTRADSWEGLGFHWNLKPHTTVSGKEVMSLMPSLFIGKVGPKKAAVAKKAAKATESASVAKAREIAKSVSNVKEFQMKAMRDPLIVADDALMAQCLEEGPDGFYAQNAE